MKKLVITAAIFAVFALPATAGDKVRISYQDSEERIDVGDLKQTSVCGLKQRIADMYDIKQKDFGLKKSGYKLHEDKTLYAANVPSNNKLQVVPVSSRSTQC